MNYQYDLVIIGGGVLGTFHAYHALKAGKKVALLEKNAKPVSATVQNFGQVVPSGMNIKWQNFGRESLNIYKDIQSQFDITVRNNGSIYIASNDEEVQLIEELYQINQANSYASQLLTKEQCLAKYSGLKSAYCKAGLFFPEEVTVEPRIMIHRLHTYMKDQPDFDIYYNTLAINIDESPNDVEVLTSNKKKFKAEKVILCSGKEFNLLYPETFNNSDLELVKLQMLLTKPQKAYKLDGSILTGLTIRRYEAFTECPSFKAIKSKEDPNAFERKWGVHILFKQRTDGSVIIGDSHEYIDAKDTDLMALDLYQDVDDFMIQEAKKIIDLPNYDIQQRWSGMYAQCKTQDIFNEKAGDRVHIVTGIGGKGMTGSAGFAKQNILNII